MPPPPNFRFPNPRPAGLPVRGNYRYVAPVNTPVGFKGSFTVRLDSELAQRQIRDALGRYKSSQTVVYEVMRDRIAPKLQELHAHAFDEAVRVGIGRQDYRKGGAYAAQRPERLLSEGLRTDPNLWGAVTGGGGVYVEPGALNRSPLARADGTRLAEYWWVQDEGFSGHVGNRVAIKGSSAVRNEKGEITGWNVQPGFKSIRDMSKRRRYGSGDRPRRSARIATVKNRIEGYDIFGNLFGETLRAAAAQNLVQDELERALLTMPGFVRGAKAKAAAADRLRQIGSREAQGLGAAQAREIITTRAENGRLGGTVLTFNVGG